MKTPKRKSEHKEVKKLVFQSMERVHGRAPWGHGCAPPKTKTKMRILDSNITHDRTPLWNVRASSTDNKNRSFVAISPWGTSSIFVFDLKLSNFFPN